MIEKILHVRWNTIGLEGIFAGSINERLYVLIQGQGIVDRVDVIQHGL